MPCACSRLCEEPKPSICSRLCSSRAGAASPWASCYRCRSPPLAHGLHGGEGLVEIRDQILDVLDTDGEANETILDAQPEPLLARALVVADGRGMGDQRLDTAQAGADAEQLEPAQHA